MPQSLIRIFAYGTLKPDEMLRLGANEYQRVCAEMLIEACEAIVFGKLYHLPLGYPAMVIEGQIVYGSLLSFADSSILQILDEYETHDPEALRTRFPDQVHEQNDYDRQPIEVFSLSQASLGLAWTYVMMPEQIDRLQGILIPSGKWSSTKNNP